MNFPTKCSGSARWDAVTSELRIIRDYINGRKCDKIYRLTFLDPHPDCGGPAVRLVQEDGESYDVIRTTAGWTCECQDFKARRENKDTSGCKHIRALRAKELIK